MVSTNAETVVTSKSLVYWSWEKSYVLGLVSSNPSNGYKMADLLLTVMMVG